MIGKTVSHYKIIRELGAGGMGVVYEAVDTKLDRKVALKFLPPESTRDPDAKARFVHEAKAASALDHPNVCVIHEIDETDDGQMFLAMACYEGETLKDWIGRGPLPVDDTLDITRQIAEGLAKAHEREIVHRDIKPANIFLTSDGLVKILDFGLAKLAGQTLLTKTGTTMGTAGYMSPEQARGETTDHRTDLWCLGVVMYEMMTGRLPFEGDHEQAILYGILNQDHEPVTGLRTGVPIELERIIGKCLAKDSAERYQHSDELLADLKSFKRTTVQDSTATLIKQPSMTKQIRWPWIVIISIFATAAVLLSIKLAKVDPSENIPDKPILAVLPFENLGDPGDAYFADGITDEILTKLSMIPGLGVIARESSFKFRGEEYTIKDIGDQLGVDFVLKGTIRWQISAEGESRVRVTPKLISVTDEQNIWADAYEEELDQIFHVQATIGEKIVEALNISLLESNRQELNTQPTNNLKAYESFLRAKEILLKSPIEENFSAAEKLLMEAIKLDPEFALAYAWLSMLCSDVHHYWVDRSAKRLEQAKIAFEKALSRDAGLPDANMAKGRYYYYAQRDYGQALKAFEMVLEKRPNDWLSIHFIGTIKKRQGQFVEALGWFEKAHKINPSSYKPLLEEAIVLRWLGNDEEAARKFERIISHWPDEATPYKNFSGHLRSIDGSTERARPVMEAAASRLGMKVNQDEWFRIFVMERKFEDAFATINDPLERAKLNYYLGRNDQMRASGDSARAIYEKRIAQEPEDFWWHWRLGLALAYLGRKTDAVREAEMAVSIMPISKDAIFGPQSVQALAQVYLLCGEPDAAMDKLEILLAKSPYVSVPVLRNHPFWDPLRDNPRFRKMVANNH